MGSRRHHVQQWQIWDAKGRGLGMIFTPNPNSIISGRESSGQGGGHRELMRGWKDTLRRIKANNPGSTSETNTMYKY